MFLNSGNRRAEHHLRLLTLASEAWDECHAAREQIRREGLTVPTKAGGPRDNEKLWLWARHKLFTCELKYHGEFGVEARIFENGELLVGYRHQTRALSETIRSPTDRSSGQAGQ